MKKIEEQLVDYLQDAHALEQHVAIQLQGLAEITEQPKLKKRFEQHQEETATHIERLKERLEHYESGPATVKDGVGILGALSKSIVDTARHDNAGKNARDGFVAEHLEIAAYELLERVADRAGDKETVQVARRNRKEEEQMAKDIASFWDEVVDDSLRQEGVRV